MPYYAWKARNGEGRVRKGILAAGCLREAGKELEARFPHILQLRPVSPFQRLFLGRQKLTDLDRETFFRKLGLLLQGGLPILRALRALEGHGSPGLRAFCRELERGLQRGMSLSQVLARQKKQAGLLAASLAEAGENSGQLPFVFQQLALFYQKKRENQKTVLQACLYPALVLCLALAYGILFLLVARAPFRGSVCFFRAAAGQGIPGAAGLPGFFPEPSSVAPPWGPGLREPACIPLERERTLAAVLSFGFPAASIFLGNPFPAAPGPAPAGRAAPGPSPAPSFWNPSSRDFPAPGCSAGKSGDCRFFPVGHRPGDAFSVQSPCSGIHGLGRRKRPAAGSFDRSCPYPGPGFPELAEKCQDPLGTGPLGLIGRRMRQSHGPPLVPSV